jgi:hypothetical protein
MFMLAETHKPEPPRWQEFPAPTIAIQTAKRLNAEKTQALFVKPVPRLRQLVIQAVWTHATQEESEPNQHFGF